MIPRTIGWEHGLKICHTCVGTNKHLLQHGDKYKQNKIQNQIRKGKFIQENFNILLTK